VKKFVYVGNRKNFSMYRASKRETNTVGFNENTVGFDENTVGLN
jgi:hypothetical protein